VDVAVSAEGFAVVDGRLVSLLEACLPVTDPAFTVGWSVFETLRVRGGRVDRWALHGERLARSAAAAEIPPPDLDTLAEEVARAAKALGGDARVRVTLTGGGRRVVVATPLDPARVFAPVTCALGAHRDEPFLGGAVKHASRAPWVVAVRRARADDVVLVDENGHFTEATTASVIAVVHGVLHTAPDDGRVLPSTTLVDVLAAAAQIGLEVVRQGALADGPLDAVYLVSATRVLAPVTHLAGRALGQPVPGAGWDPVGERLRGALAAEA
jgi:4-amino-4-deoxychorismate lyase